MDCLIWAVICGCTLIRIITLSGIFEQLIFQGKSFDHNSFNT